MSAESPSVPQAIGRYRVVERLASDSVDEVYRGFDPMIERPVVVKVFPLQVGDPAVIADIKKTFYDEMRRTGVLMHQSIATLFDAGETTGALFAASELVEGVTLTEFLEAHADMDLPLRTSLIGQMVDALEYARALGVAHLNLKPTNVLVASDYVLKIAGFGVAPVLEVLTSAASVDLRPPSKYAAPERVRGEAADHRADVYSLAALALDVFDAPLELRPADRDDVVPQMPGTLSAHGATAERWQEVFAKALAHDPTRRHASAAAFKFDLMMMLGVDEVAARLAWETSRALADTWPASPDPRPHEAGVAAMFAETLLQPSGDDHGQPLTRTRTAAPIPRESVPARHSSSPAADDDGETKLIPDSSADDVTKRR